MLLLQAVKGLGRLLQRLLPELLIFLLEGLDGRLLVQMMVVIFTLFIHMIPQRRQKIIL
jgi:hypothetical protein